MTEIVLDAEDDAVKRITFIKPDDWHLHVRDGEMLHAVLPYTERVCGRAIIMPNLTLPVTTVAHAVNYRSRISAALPSGSKFEPLMTLYLTDNTSPDEIVHAKESGIVHGVKLYPAGATTNSAAGVTCLSKVGKVFEVMEHEGIPLLIHGEVVDSTVDIFDRERCFLKTMENIMRSFPGLRIVLEHVTTKDGVDFVKEAGPNIAATITAHHLHINRNDILVGGIKPHNYCLPVAKREKHRLALIRAATSGNKKFMLGTDSAPHPIEKKEAACGCAGCFTAPSAIELYLRVFEQAGKLEHFEAFASTNGPDFYGLPHNTSLVTYENVDNPWFLPNIVHFAEHGSIVPFRVEEGLHWRLVNK